MAGTRQLKVEVVGTDKSGSQTLRNLGADAGKTADQSETAGSRIKGAFSNALGSLKNSGALAPFMEQIDMAEKAVDALAEHGKSAGKVMLAGGGAALGLGGGLTMVAQGDIQAEAQLKAAIETTGESIDDYEGKIGKAASTGADFGHTNKEVDASLQKLVSSYGDTNQALDRMQLVEDLAAAKHISLTDAANIVAKAHGGAGRIFKEFGITVGQNADGTKNYEGALDQLSQKVSGQADASMEGFGGTLKKVRAEVENAVASFGQKYGPAVMAAGAASTAIGGIWETVGAIRGRLNTVEEVGTGATVALTAAEEEQEVATMSLGGAIGGAAAAIGVLILAYEAWQNGSKATVNTQNIAKVSTDQLVFTYNTLGDKFGGTGRKLDVFRQIADANIATAKRLRDQIAAQGGDVSQLDAILTDAANAQVQANNDQQDGSDVTQQYATDTQNTTDKVKQFTDALQGESDALKAQLDPFFGLLSANQQLQGAQQQTTDAQTKLNDAVRDYGPNSAQAIAAQAALDQANSQAVTSAEGVQVAVRNLQQAVADHKTTLGDAISTMQQWVNQGLITQGQANAISTAFTNIGNQAAALDGRDVTIGVNFRLSSAQQQTINMLDQAFGIPNIAGQRARGGPVMANRAYIVGEDRPEVFVPTQDGTILPSVPAALGGGGSSSVVVQAGGIVVYAQDGTDAGTKIAAALEDYVRRGGQFGSSTRAAITR